MIGNKKIMRTSSFVVFVIRLVTTIAVEEMEPYNRK
jgi:hypothetical protein